MLSVIEQTTANPSVLLYRLGLCYGFTPVSHTHSSKWSKRRVGQYINTLKEYLAAVVNAVACEQAIILILP